MKIECPKCHQHYEIDESHIGPEIECGCGERIRISLTVELALRPKRKASFFQIFVCVYLILILVSVCGGLGWGYSEIRRLNKNLYKNHVIMGCKILEVSNEASSIQGEISSMESDINSIKRKISSIESDIDELSTRLWGTLPPYGLEFSGGLIKKIEKIQDSIDTIQLRLNY